jgi:hypothetical protein
LSLQVAKIRGIPIRLHFTLVVGVILISWTIAETLMPQMYPHQGLTNVHYWIGKRNKLLSLKILGMSSNLSILAINLG